MNGCCRRFLTAVGVTNDSSFPSTSSPHARTDTCSHPSEALVLEYFQHDTVVGISARM